MLHVVFCLGSDRIKLRLFDSQINVHVKMERLWTAIGWGFYLHPDLFVDTHLDELLTLRNMYTLTKEKRWGALIKCSCFPSKAGAAEAVWNTPHCSIIDINKRKVAAALLLKLERWHPVVINKKFDIISDW